MLLGNIILASSSSTQAENMKIQWNFYINKLGNT